MGKRVDPDQTVCNSVCSIWRHYPGRTSFSYFRMNTELPDIKGNIWYLYFYASPLITFMACMDPIAFILG